MNREQILARLAEIRSLTENPTENMDVPALTEEARSLKAQLALLDAVEVTAAENRSAVANGAGTPVANLADQAQARAAAPAVSPLEARAADFVAHNSMRIPMFAEGRSVLVSSGKLALPKAVANEIGELPAVVSSIVDDVDAIDATGTGTWEFPYRKTDAAAAAVTEGSAIGGTAGTFDKVTISPEAWGILDEISNQVKKMTPVNYQQSIQNNAYLALRREARNKIVTKVLASTLLETVAGMALDATYIRKLVLGYDADESVAGNAKLYINKADLQTLGAIRGTNEKKAVFEIEFTDANNGTIKDGAMLVPFSICAALTAGTQLYGNPRTIKMLMWDNYEVSTDDGGDYFKRNMLGIRGLQTAGAGLAIWHGMQKIIQANS